MYVGDTLLQCHDVAHDASGNASAYCMGNCSLAASPIPQACKPDPNDTRRTCNFLRNTWPTNWAACAGDTLLQCHDVAHDAAGNAYVSGRCVGNCTFGSLTLSTAAIPGVDTSGGYDGPYAAAFAAFIVRISSIGTALIHRVHVNTCTAAIAGVAASRGL